MVERFMINVIDENHKIQQLMLSGEALREVYKQIICSLTVERDQARRRALTWKRAAKRRRSRS